MALPGRAGAALASSMGKAGLMSPMAGEPAADDTAAPEDDGGVEAIISDIDAKFPGLGPLMSELVDRLKADDEAQDATEG